MIDQKMCAGTDMTRTFYNKMASQYDKLFFDWQVTTRQQAELLNVIFQENGFDLQARILDCACGKNDRHTLRLISTRLKKASGYLFRHGNG